MYTKNAHKSTLRLYLFHGYDMLEYNTIKCSLFYQSHVSKKEKVIYLMHIFMLLNKGKSKKVQLKWRNVLKQHCFSLLILIWLFKKLTSKSRLSCTQPVLQYWTKFLCHNVTIRCCHNQTLARDKMGYGLSGLYVGGYVQLLSAPLIVAIQTRCKRISSQ